MLTAGSTPPRMGPRIYNLFPLLAGRVRAWHDHLERIAAMGVSWVYVNAFHYRGFSGSLDAIKDPFRLNDLFADAATRTRRLVASWMPRPGTVSRR